MLKLANRVKETSISTGTGSVILRGGFGAFQTFSSAIGNANSTFYTIENETRWEVGIGTYTSVTNSLSRDTVLSSSNGGSKIDLNGVSIVFCTLPAEKTVFFGDNNYLPEGKPLTLTRESAGNFIHAFVDNSSDETVALHMQDSNDPTWKFGLKNTPNSKTTAPQYGYVYGSNGTAGLYGDSDAYAYMDSNLGFYIVHESSNLVQVTKDGGTEIKNGSANVNALTVKGAAAQSYPLQVWTNNAGTTLSSVSSDGSLALGKSGGANYTLDVDGTANVTTLRFSDGSSQTTASKPSGEFVGLSGVVETNKTNVATNTAQIAINKATTVDVSGLLTGPYSAASGTLINTHFMPLVSGQVVMPISSGDVINTMLAAIDQGGGGGGDGLPTSSGALINTHFLPKSSGNAIYLPISSGANITANFMPLFSGIAINTFFATKQDEITASNRIDSAHIAGGNVSNTEFGFLNGVTDDIQTQLDGKIPTSSGYLPISSGDVINTLLAAQEQGGLPTSSGAAINAHFMPMVSGDVKYLPVASGAIINDALIDILGGSIPKDSGYLPIASGAVINAHFAPLVSGDAKFLPIASGAAINAHFAPLVSGDAKFLPISSGAVINDALIDVLGGSIPKDSGYLPIASGAVINAHFAPLVSGDAKFLPISSGANISANFMPLHSGIAINADYMPTVSGAAINAHFMPMVSGDAKYIPISSGAAINAHFMPMVSGDVKYLPVASGDVINDAFVDIVDSATPSAGSGLLKIGNTFHAVSGSIITSGVVMLTNDVSSNLTPSGKAVTPQGVINYAEPIISASNRVPANLIHDGSISNTEFGFLEGIGDNIQGQLNDKVQIAGSGLIKIGTTMHAASGSIVASGAVMLTNDVHENLSPSGKAVTTQGVINYITENANLKVGRDSENLIDFATTDNKIILRANDINQVSLIDNVFGPETDSDVDLGTSAKRWKDAYVDSITVTGEVDGASLDISGDADIDGTTNLDAVDIDGNVQIDGTVTVGVDDTGKDVKFFGATAGKYMLWDESADKLDVIGTVGISGALTLDASLNQDPAIQTGANDAVAIDCGLSNYHEITIDNTVNSLVFTNVTVGQRIVLKVTNHSTHKDMDANDGWDTITVNGSSKTAIWPGGTVPTLTEANNAVDVYGILFDSSLVPNCFIIGQHLQ